MKSLKSIAFALVLVITLIPNIDLLAQCNDMYFALFSSPTSSPTPAQFTFDLNMDIGFTSGTTYSVEWFKDVNAQGAGTLIVDQGAGDDVVFQNVTYGPFVITNARLSKYISATTTIGARFVLKNAAGTVICTTPVSALNAIIGSTGGGGGNTGGGTTLPTPQLQTADVFICESNYPSQVAFTISSPSGYSFKWQEQGGTSPYIGSAPDPRYILGESGRSLTINVGLMNIPGDFNWDENGNRSKKFNVCTVNGSGICSSSMAVATLTLRSMPVVSAGDDATVCTASATLTLSGTPGGGTWKVDGIAITGNNFNPPLYSAGAHVVAYTYSDPLAAGCTNQDFRVITTVAPPVLGMLRGPSKVLPEISYEYEVINSISSESFLWEIQNGVINSGQGRSAVSVSFGEDGGALTVSAANTYCGSTSAYTLNVLEGRLNYVKEDIVLVAGVNDPSVVENIVLGKRSTVTTYFDGLGRPMQRVDKQGSPTAKDVVQPMIYDAYGRESIKYLPYVSDRDNGKFKKDPTGIPDNYTGSPHYQFYNGSDPRIASDTKPFAVAVFEPSPLGRVLKEGSPGEAWQPNADPMSINDHTRKMRYDGNANEEVLLFRYDAVTNLIALSSVPSERYFKANQLVAAKVYDETNGEIIEYTDKAGRVVCKKQKYAEMNGSSLYAATYYVYNDFGLLACVIPPEAVKNILKDPSDYLGKTNDGKDAFLSLWTFRYKYDARKRMIEKQVPGAAAVYMVYDNRDRLVLSQDGEQRKKNQWAFTKYDVLNRPIMTGLYTHNENMDQSEMSQNVSTVILYETFDVTQPHYYTNNVFPLLSASTNVLTVTYYDNYAFAATFGTDFSYKPAQVTSQVVDGVTYSQPAAANTMVIGLVTGIKVKNLGDGTWLRTATYYDDKYRAIQTTAEHQRKGVDRATNLYDFAGKVLATKTEHTEAGIVWKDMVNVTQSGNELKKAAIPYGANAGAASVQVLPAGQDGWVEMVYPGTGGTGSEQFFGLNDTNPDVDGGNINYAFLITANNAAGNVRVYENGVLRVGLGLAKVKGDVLRIERVGTQVTYKVNGAVGYTSQVPSTTSLMADVTILQSRGYTYGTRASFAQRSQSVTRRFEYDHAGRLLNTWHSINTQPEVLLAKNAYNELGQLVTKNLHGTSNNFKQHTDYRYNIRGWLTTINDPAIPQSGDLFNMSLHYNDPTAKGGAPQYNGNISETIWSSAGLDKQSYGYNYDALNRLTEAKYYNTVVPTEDGRYNEKIGDVNLSRPGYDMNGNILNLFRNGRKTTTAFGAMDDLGYTYANGGNQLTAVTDGIPTQPEENGFKEATEGILDYTYDANGNMTKDVNKGIDSIKYNHLNLPIRVRKSNGEFLTYAYDASGRKLRQQVYNAGGVLQKSTEYNGEFIHERSRKEEPQGFSTLVASDFSAGIDGFTSTGGCTLEGNIDNVSGRNDVLKITTVTAANNQHYFAKLAAIAEQAEKYIIRADFFIPESNTSFNGFTVTNSSGGQVLLDARNMQRGVWAHYESGLVEYGVGSWFALRACSNTTIVFPSNGETGYIVNLSIERADLYKDQLQFINHEEGRVVMTGAEPEYQYHLKDHLGNVRLTFTTKDEVETTTATLETANASEENTQYLHYNEAVIVNHPVFDHTHDDSPGEATNNATRLTGGNTNAKFGLARSLCVMPGDEISMEVYAKYLDLDPDPENWAAT